MSKDRVRFILPSRRTHSQEANPDNVRAMKSILHECFGINPNQIPAYTDLTIICRPSQFARFLIKRNKAGLQNNFSELKAELVEPQEVAAIIDVSTWDTRLRQSVS